MDDKDFLKDLPQATPSYTPPPDGQVPGEGLVIETGTLLADRYEVKERIGAGGMGAVFKAFDRNRDKDIAIKVLLPNLFTNEAAKERFAQEAQISSELSHPNIVNVFDIVVTDELTFLTMELLEGQNLREYMDAQHRGIDQEEAITIIQDVVHALEYAHKSMVHRDIKPENIFICDDGTIKLMDFGIAQAQSFSRASKVGMSLGTAYYMAPEQLKAKGKVDARADQYALAVLCYELLIGELPTGAVKSPHEIKKTIPKKLSLAIMTGMEPKADERFTDIKAFGKALSGKSTITTKFSLKWGIAAGLVIFIAGVWLLGEDSRRNFANLFTSSSSQADQQGVLSQLRESFFPDPEIEKEAIAMSAELETLEKAIERREKQLKEKKQEIKAEANRIESYLRTAKGEEKDTLKSSLSQMKIEEEAADYAYDLFVELSTSADSLIEGQKLKSTGNALMKAGNFREALESFKSSIRSFTKINSISDMIEEYASSKANLNALKDEILGIDATDKKGINDLSTFSQDVNESFRLADRQAGKLNFNRANDFLAEFDPLVDNWLEIKAGFEQSDIARLVALYEQCELTITPEQYNFCYIPDYLAYVSALNKNTITAFGQYAKSNGLYVNLADQKSGERINTLKSWEALEVYKTWFPEGRYISWVNEQFQERTKNIESQIKAAIQTAYSLVGKYYNSNLPLITEYETRVPMICRDSTGTKYKCNWQDITCGVNLTENMQFNLSLVTVDREKEVVKFNVNLNRNSTAKTECSTFPDSNNKWVTRSVSMIGEWVVSFAELNASESFDVFFNQNQFKVTSVNNAPAFFREYAVNEVNELNTVLSCQLSRFYIKKKVIRCITDDLTRKTFDLIFDATTL